MTAADKVFKMLEFQYKPIEKIFLAHVPKDIQEKYKASSSARKIAVLDKVAAQIGL